MRIKSGPAQRRRKKRILKAASGYWGAKHRIFRQAKPAVIRAYRYSWEHRREKKRDIRRLWIARINAATREKGISYSKFMAKLKEKNIELNRKVLADLATSHKEAFFSLVDKVFCE